MHVDAMGASVDLRCPQLDQLQKRMIETAVAHERVQAPHGVLALRRSLAEIQSGFHCGASVSRVSISRFEQLLHFGAADRMLQHVEAAADEKLFADLLDQRHDS